MITFENKQFNPLAFKGWSEAKFLAIYGSHVTNAKLLYGQINEFLSRVSEARPDGDIKESPKRQGNKKANTRPK